ncbi:MAG TPA: hypothetical protein VM537_35850 [Anaerolineae bacterium]|nr:hypothetical protein [Anaerolineae bacterium]
MAAEKRLVEVPKLKIETVSITIEGTPPGLLVNKRDERIAKDTPPQKEAELHLHKLDPEREGCLYGFPAVGIRKCVADCAGRTSSKAGTVVKANMFIVPGPDGLVPIDAPGFQPFTRWGGQARKNQIRLTSAHFPEWQMHLSVQYNVYKITLQELLQYFAMAGFANGIGTWRPENNGLFGRFVVVNGG